MGVLQGLLSDECGVCDGGRFDGVAWTSRIGVGWRDLGVGGGVLRQYGPWGWWEIAIRGPRVRKEIL